MAGIHAVGVERVSIVLAVMRVRSIEASRKALEEILNRVARQERTLLSLGYHPPGTKTGSVPPSPPWRISGAFVRSVGIGDPRLSFGLRGLSWRGTVGANIVYARIHEKGGWTGKGHRTYLPPRPHLEPAWKIVRPGMRIQFEHQLKYATRPK